MVEQIPLVLYIPPPPEDAEKDFIASPKPVYKSNNSEHTYPPKSPPLPKRRFTFIRSFSSKSGASGKSGDKKADTGASNEKGEPIELREWEDQWEGSEYPFVRLEGNRAACAICLMDFEEPKRIAGNVIKAWARKSGEAKEDEDGSNKEDVQTEKETKGEVEQKGKQSAERSQAEMDEQGNLPVVGESRHEVIREVPVAESSNAVLHLEDAGEGSQPLRLLSCGHVFHVSLWFLLSVSFLC